jgi:hypothetical protein
MIKIPMPSLELLHLALEANKVNVTKDLKPVLAREGGREGGREGSYMYCMHSMAI